MTKANDLKGEGHSGDWWSFMGYSCTSRGGLSYDCPALKLYGYANDLQLHRAIKRAVAKRVKEATRPTHVFGYTLDAKTLTPVRETVDMTTPGDYGADPLGDGTFRMVPSGDVVDFAERNRRLDARRAKGATR